jgi:hypothetical protein
MLYTGDGSYGVLKQLSTIFLDLQLPVQSVPIATKVVRSDPVHGEVYSMQHYVIKFVSDLQQIGAINEKNWFAESRFFVGVHWMEFADTTLGISEYLFFATRLG